MAQRQGSTAVADAPDTLPGDFFDKQKQDAPDTLPGDFFEKKNAAAQSGAFQQRKGGPVLNAKVLGIDDQSRASLMRDLQNQAATGGRPEQTLKSIGREGALGVSSGYTGMPESLHPLRDTYHAMQADQEERMAHPLSLHNVGEAMFGPQIQAYQLGKGLLESGGEIGSGLTHLDAEKIAHGGGRLVGQLGQFATGKEAAVGEPTGAGGAIGTALRTEGGQLRPIVHAGAKLGGALAGHLTGLPEAGLAGYLTGPQLLESIVPNRPTKLVHVGASLPDAGEFYEHRGAELNKIRSMNDVLERRTARESKSAASAATPEPAATEGPALPKAQVIKLPVPREPLPTDNPGYMASIPRSRLLDLGRQGRPGAGQQLQNTGKSVIYVQESYPGPRDPERLQRIGAGTELNPIQVKPEVRPQYQYKPSEKASTMSAERPNLGQEFETAQVSHEIERNKSILRNPRATAEDRRIAQDRLRDAEAQRTGQ